jgi:hypothetical protein
LLTSSGSYDLAIIKGYYEGPEGAEPGGEGTNPWRTSGMEQDRKSVV